MENKKPISEWTLAETKKYCNGKRCTDCPFYDNDKEECVMHGTPNSWKFDKPEIVAVEYIHCPAAATETPNKPAKSRLAEVLGVEEDEPIRIVGGAYDTVPFTIADVIASDGSLMAGAVTCAIIHPEYIIRAPRLTEAELAICKAVGAKWVSRADKGLRVELWDVKPDKTLNLIYVAQGVGPLARVNVDLFPSVRPGDCICVEEAGGDE